MIFELNTSFDINTSWDSEEESIQYHGQDLLAEKTLSVTLNDIKLKPLYKKGPKIDPKNYRPISLLPRVSKIIEKIIHDQTMEYLTDNKILYRYQSGFRKNHSTDTCLSYLTDKILTGFDSGLLTGMILIDLQKAFDTINHDILLFIYLRVTCCNYIQQMVLYCFLWWRNKLTHSLTHMTTTSC